MAINDVCVNIEIKIVQQVIKTATVKGDFYQRQKGKSYFACKGEGKAPVLRGSVLCPM